MNESLILLNFVVHVASTLLMTGMIWFVQLVQYPLLRYVGHSDFPDYEERQRWFTRWVVVPPMLIEAVSALLLFRFRPAGVPTWSLVAGSALLVAIWLWTILVQARCQLLLRSGYDDIVHRQLLLTNWLRTAAWSLRAVLLMWKSALALC